MKDMENIMAELGGNLEVAQEKMQKGAKKHHKDVEYADGE